VFMLSSVHPEEWFDTSPREGRNRRKRKMGELVKSVFFSGGVEECAPREVALAEQSRVPSRLRTFRGFVPRPGTLLTSGYVSDFAWRYPVRGGGVHAVANREELEAALAAEYHGGLAGLPEPWWEWGCVEDRPGGWRLVPIDSGTFA
jgi:hypothetical protein